MNLPSRLMTAAFLALVAAAAPAVAGDYEKRAPFTAVRWEGSAPVIQVQGKWHRLRSLDGIEAEAIVVFCKKTYGDRWQKRFVEDLVEVLSRMGHKPGETVKLVLADVDGGKEVTLPKAPMTEENRKAARNARQRPAPAPVKRKRERYPKLAPFTATRTDKPVPEVQVLGRWYRLLALDGISSKDIVTYCKQKYGGRWDKRFTEDLVEVLHGMGHQPGPTVALKLQQLDDDKIVELPAAPMTEENRRAAWHARHVPRKKAPVRRVSRDRHTSFGEYHFLQKLVPGADGGGTITMRQAREDLDELEWILEHHYSYLTLRGVDYRTALDALRSGLRRRVSRNAFALGLTKLLGLFGDGHTRVAENPARLMAPGYAPFLIGEADGKPVAFLADRSGLLDPGHPYLVSIDGVPVERWMDAAARYATWGSPQLVRRDSLRNLRYVAQLRREMGRPAGPKLVAEVAFAKGKTARHELKLAEQKPAYGMWPRTISRVLDGNVGYLRIPLMLDDERFLRNLDGTMKGFKDTRALVIDVRGNGGGSRQVLRRMLPYFLRDGEAAVVNVGAYRLHVGDRPDNPQGYLQNRFLYPAAWPEWSPAARTAIRKLAAQFKPSFQPPQGKFSAWHYFVIERSANPAAYRYTKPVVVLIDAGCFSATDIFVGAFTGRPGVTLMGSATSGGSGRARGYVLAHSGIRLRISSMASFRPTGAGYDTKGIAPDVVVRTAAADWVAGSDTVLDAALEALK